MNIQEYIEAKRHIYSEFAECVYNILRTAISNAGQIDGVQQIQRREKDVNSLSRKLKEQNKYHSDTIENDIKDLAGCRLIFYHNDDLNWFLNSSIIRDNFNIDWDQTKIHYPNSDAQSANDFYTGHHFVVTLKPERAQLHEFAKFADLRCEIQAQTLLNHAWSETIHDITYKRHGPVGFGERSMKKIEERLVNIMKDHLRPASHEFQKVKHDLKILEAGQEIFDMDIHKTIKEISDANELYDLLERYNDYVLPHYSDYESVCDDIYRIAESSLKRARQLGVTPVMTPFGSFDGKDYKDILSVCMDILKNVRYLDLDRTLTTLNDVGNSHTVPAEQDIINKYVLCVASYNADVLRQYGCIVQEKLIDALTYKSNEELVKIFWYTIIVCEAILTPHLEERQQTHDKFTIGKANLPGSADLARIRSKALELLKRLITKGNRSIKQRSFACMEQATQTPRYGRCDEKLQHIILTDTNTVIDSYIEDVDNLDFEMIQANEEKIFSHFLHAKDILNMENQPEVLLEAAHETVNKVRQFREKVSALPFYDKYKILVGYKSIFDYQWDNEEISWEKKDTFRNEQIGVLVDLITEDNINEWIDFFDICAEADSSDMATFHFFSKFLIAFAEKKPELAKTALEQVRTGQDRFIASILSGLSNIGRTDIIEEIIRPNIARGEHLWECILPFTILPSLSRDLLHQAKDRAIELDDRYALYFICLAAILDYDKDPGELNSLFIPAIETLTELHDTGWIKQVSHKKETVRFLQSIDRTSAKKILDNLVWLKELDYFAEYVIEVLLENDVDIVLEFFGDRYDIENAKVSNDDYEAIPYTFQKLQTPLSQYPELIVNTVFDWYKKSPNLFQYRGARLVTNTFPKFDERVEQRLLQLVQTKNDEELDFVISIMRDYKGQPFLHKICRDIVILEEGQGPFSGDVEIVLQETSVVHGDFGFVDIYKQKKKEIEHWLEDPELVVREFAKKYIHMLDLQIASEQRRAEEDLELRKRVYN